MRIVIDYNGSKVFCRVTHYLNEKNPHYNDYTDIKNVEDDVWMIIVAALKELAVELKKDLRQPFWKHGNSKKNKSNTV